MQPRTCRLHPCPGSTRLGGRCSAADAWRQAPGSRGAPWGAPTALGSSGAAGEAAGARQALPAPAAAFGMGHESPAPAASAPGPHSQGSHYWPCRRRHTLTFAPFWEEKQKKPSAGWRSRTSYDCFKKNIRLWALPCPRSAGSTTL